MTNTVDRLEYRAQALGRRRFLSMCGTAVAGVVLTACGGSDSGGNGGQASPGGGGGSPGPTAVGAAGGLPQSPIAEWNVGYDNPQWSHHVADIIAREKGFFEEVGITEVDQITFDDSMTAIVGGGVMWTAHDTDALIMAILQEGVEVVWLGTRRDNEDLLFGLAPGVTVEDLRGSGRKASGGRVGSRNELLGKFMASELGLDPDADLEWITLGGGSDTRLAALINGDLAASNIQERHITRLEEAGGTVVYNERRAVAQEGYTVQTSFLQENEDAVVAYLAGIIKAKQYIHDLSTKDEVIEIMTANGFDFPQEFIDAYESGIEVLSDDCGFEVEEMQVLWDELAEIGEVEDGFPWRDAVNLEYLWAAQEANDLPRRPESLDA